MPTLHQPELVSQEPTLYRCSVCGKESDDKTNFYDNCPGKGGSIQPLGEVKFGDDDFLMPRIINIPKDIDSITKP